MPLEGFITLIPLTPDGLAEGEYRMKKLILTAAFVLLSAPMAFAQTQGSCAKIIDGTITDTAGNPITLGYDQYGYNYQAHMFNGTYDSSDRTLDGLYWGAAADYTDDSLIMKWSDEWLSNLDCNGDSKLDRGLDAKTGESTGKSMGWLTNQVEGDYIGLDLDSHHYTYFAKIVFVGPVPPGTDPWAATRLWGTFAIIEEVYNDPFGGFHGVDRNSLVNPAGLGFWTN